MKKHIITFCSLLLFTTYVKAAVDVGVSSVTTPLTGCQLSNAEEVKVTIFNYGDAVNLATFNVRYTVNGGTPVSQLYVDASFDPNETAIVAFVTKADLSTPGTYTIKIYTDLGTESNRANDTMTVTIINYAPTVAGTLTSDATVCSGTNGGTLTLAGNTGNPVQWEYSDDGGFAWVPIINTTTSQTYLNLTATRKFRVLVKNGTCASAYSNIVTITVDPLPVGGFVQSNATVCTGNNGDTLQLSGHTGIISKWQKDSGGGFTDVTNTDDTLIYNNLTVTTKYRAVITSGVCPSANSSFAQITVISATVGGTLLGTATECSGSNNDTLTLINHAGDIQWWESSIDGGFVWSVVSNTDTMQIYNNLTQTTQYRVRVQGGTCPGAYSSIVTIIVNPQSVGGTIQSDASVCSGTNGDTLILSGYTGTVTKWQKNTGSGWIDIANTDDTLIYNNLTITTQYRAVVTSGVCPPAFSSFATITLIANTVGGTIVPANDTVCSGSNNDTLNLTGHVGDIKWWESSTDGGFVWSLIGNTSTQQIYNNITITTKYRVYIQGGGCPDVYSTVATINVDAPSVGGTVQSNAVLCDSVNNGTLHLVGFTSSVLMWQSQINGASWTSISNTADSLVFSNIVETTTFRAVAKNGVCSADTSLPATLTSSITIADFSAPNVCLNNNTQFTNLSSVASNATITNYQWEFADNTASTAQNPVHLYAAAATYPVSLTITTSKGCIDSVTKNIQVYSLPDPTITAAGPVAFCEGGSVQLSVPATASYAWSTGESTQNITVSAMGSYTVTVTDNNTCQNSDSINITVYPLPIAEAGNDTSISLGQTITLQGSGGVSYLWSPAASLSNPNIQNPLASPSATTEYIVVVTDANSCVSSDSVIVTVIVDYDFTVSNLITPNGDGYNDFWNIENLAAYPDCEVAVFNRYGQLLFQQVNYTNDWDGTFQGKLLPDGTYYYVITCPKTDKVAKGHVTILSK